MMIHSIKWIKINKNKKIPFLKWVETVTLTFKGCFLDMNVEYRKNTKKKWRQFWCYPVNVSDFLIITDFEIKKVFEKKRIKNQWWAINIQIL